MNKQIAALATDENNMVMWDMDALLSDCKNHPYVTVDTKMLVVRNRLTIDTKYALTTDVNRPIILFELPDNQWFVADGNHRLYRAVKESVPKMNVIVIPQKVHLSYLYNSTIELYHRVITDLKKEGIFIENFLPRS